jgi:hypothetical protein
MNNNWAADAIFKPNMGECGVCGRKGVRVARSPFILFRKKTPAFRRGMNCVDKNNLTFNKNVL